MRRIELDVDEIVRLYTQEGMRAAAIGRQLGCSGSIVLARLHEAGVKPNRRASIDPEEARSLYVGEGWSLNRIGEHYGAASQTVGRLLRSMGVEMRSHVASLQPQGRRPCPVGGPIRSYLLGFVWGDLAVERSERSQTISVRGSTTHEAQRKLIDDVFTPFGPVRWWVCSSSFQARVSLDLSFEFLFDKYRGRVPAWVRGPECEAAFAAGYIDAEGSFGVYDGRARFKLDSYDGAVHQWLGEWLTASGVQFRQRIVRRKGDPRDDHGSYKSDLWRTNVNESFALLRLAATLDPYLRHARRRARMDAAVANIRERLRSRALL